MFKISKEHLKGLVSLEVCTPMKLKEDEIITPCFVAKYQDHEEMGLEVIYPGLGKFETVFIKDPNVGIYSPITDFVSEREYQNLYEQIKPFLVKLKKLEDFV